MTLLKASNMPFTQPNWEMMRALSGAALFFANVLMDAGIADAIVEQALAINPNLASAWVQRGWISMFLGRHEAALDQFQYALRLNPLDEIHRMEAGLAAANFFCVVSRSPCHGPANRSPVERITSLP